MPDAVLIDAIGRRRSKVTLPGYLAGRAPHNKGMTYPADPPRVEEIIARHAPRRRGPARPAGPGGDRGAVARRPADLRGAGARRDATSTRPRVGADPARQGRQTPRGRDGRLGVRAPQPLARAPRPAAGRTAVLHHRRPDPRPRVACDRCPWRAAPARRRRPVSAAGSRRTSSGMRTRSSSPAKACRSTSSSASSGIPTSVPPAPTCRALTRPSEIVNAVHSRRQPTIPAAAGLNL